MCNTTDLTTICPRTTRTITSKVSFEHNILAHFIYLTGAISEDVPQHRQDDIKTEYHPHSQRPPETVHFEDYNARKHARYELNDEEPWRPFRSRIDFEFAEITLKAALDKDLTDSLIRLVHRSINETGSFTLKNHADMQDMWNKSAAKLTAVS
jgi:hypothetical protein